MSVDTHQLMTAESAARRVTLRSVKRPLWVLFAGAVLAGCDVDSGVQQRSNDSYRSMPAQAVSVKAPAQPVRAGASTIKRSQSYDVPTLPPAQDTTADANASKASVSLKWQVPQERENGEALSVQDIKGYEIYLAAESGITRTIRIDDPNKTNVEVKDLDPATYHFAMAVIDSDGEFSDLSNTILKTIK